MLRNNTIIITNIRKEKSSTALCSIPRAASPRLLALLLAFLLLAGLPPATGAKPPLAPLLQGQLNPPGYFSDDYYKVRGGPDLQVSMERSRTYQGEITSLFLTVANRGRISSFQVNEEPDPARRDEVLAAGREQELENQRTVAQDVSVRLAVANKSAMEVKREVAYAGSLREGQVSSRLEYPLEVYQNTTPGEYLLSAVMNYTYQRDVAVVAKEERPENPDIYYWHDSGSQVMPLKLTVERHSGAEFRILGLEPANLRVGSSDNVVRIQVKNVGDDAARDLVARLRPESGLYVSVDESPLPTLAPGEEAELIYKLDVSQDAVPGKLYQVKLLFEFSDSYRDDLTDSENAYLTIEDRGLISLWPLGLILAAAAAVFFVRRHKKAA
ncbi:MAG: hypothetical protein GKC10_03615 [Methanosarcinales archaeon]|nr:hypothetical protein [Methanosarcinales archaeon]